MTKGKRSRQREKRRQAEEQGQQNGMPMGTAPAKAVRDAVEKSHSQTAKNESKGDVQMPTNAGVSEWIRENANAVIAVFTIVIAVIAGIQACIYNSQLNWTKIVERPWIVVKFTPFSGPILNAKLPAPVLIANTGETVATNVEGWVFFRPVPIGT